MNEIISILDDHEVSYWLMLGNLLYISYVNVMDHSLIVQGGTGRILSMCGF